MGGGGYAGHEILNTSHNRLLADPDYVYTAGPKLVYTAGPKLVPQTLTKCLIQVEQQV